MSESKNDINKIPTRRKGSLIDATQPVFLCSTPMIRDGKQAEARSHQNGVEPVPKKILVGLENLEMSIIAGPWPASPVKYFSKSRTLTLKCKQREASKDKKENNVERQCPLSPKSKGAVVSSVQLVSSTPMHKSSEQPVTSNRKSLRLHNLSLSMIVEPQENKQTVSSSKQLVSSTPMHKLNPQQSDTAKRKSLHNLSVSMIAEPKGNKPAKTIKKSVSNKMQKRREMFKMKMTAKSNISLAHSATITTITTTNSSTSKPLFIPSSPKKMVLEISKSRMETKGTCPPSTSDSQNFAKPEPVVSALNGKQKRVIRNTKNGFTKKKTCPPPSAKSNDVLPSTQPKIDILTIKKMTNEELSSLDKTALSKEEYIAVKKRRQYLKVCHSMRASSLPPPSSNQPQSQSVRSASPQPESKKEFVVPTNLARQSLRQRSPSKFTTKVKNTVKPTGKLKRRRSSKSKKDKQDNAETSSGKSQLAKVGTLKRKRQIREILTQQNSTNTLLDSTPMKSIKTSKIPFVDAMSPMSFGTPPVISKAKVSRKSSPRVYTPTNRVNQDRYIKELERRNKVNVGKPGESSKMCDSVSSSQVPAEDISKVLCEAKKPSVDSDCSMDEYFSEFDTMSESD